MDKTHEMKKKKKMIESRNKIENDLNKSLFSKLYSTDNWHKYHVQHAVLYYYYVIYKQLDEL